MTRRRRPARPAALLATSLVLALAACGGEGGGGAGAAPGIPDPKANTYAPELGINLTGAYQTAGGVYYQDVQTGTGPAAVAGRPVTVHYTGWLPNGKQFDSSRGNSPLAFTLGAGDVIRGWEEGVAGMRVGGRRKLVIPAAMGYGEAGMGADIPPNSTLVFDVELLGVQ
jgi:FKBP-type peptidyl-prolyl cis-trans isomerase